MATSTPKIGVLICSQRSPRVGDQIGTFIYQALKMHQQSTSATAGYELSLIDLADHALPMFDEPVIPQMIRDPSGYHHEHTRAWSRFISPYSAFVFVTPQHNWSMPANLKNAIDYLFNEWAGKPAMVVSYGGHGGGHSAAHLKQVLTAIKMKVVSEHVELAFPKMGEDGRGFVRKAAKGEQLGLVGEGDEKEGLWRDKLPEVKARFDEMVQSM
jgi:NAD(P)H-dependent FMN reductase